MLAEPPKVHELGVQMSGTRITGTLDCRFARMTRALRALGCEFAATPRFDYAEIPFLDLSGSTVPGFQGDGIRVTGEVRLLGAEIGGDLDCTGGRFESPGGCALNAERARVEGAIFLREMDSPEGGINLASARAAVLVDDAAGWPGPGELAVDRFEYKSIGGTDVPVDAKSRLDWLCRA